MGRIIPKRSSPNVPAKLLREIRESATSEIKLEITDKIKDFIRNSLTQDEVLEYTPSIAKLERPKQRVRPNKGKATSTKSPAEIKRSTTSIWSRTATTINRVFFQIISPLFSLATTAAIRIFPGFSYLKPR